MCICERDIHELLSKDEEEKCGGDKNAFMFGMLIVTYSWRHGCLSLHLFPSSPLPPSQNWRKGKRRNFELSVFPDVSCKAVLYSC